MSSRSVGDHSISTALAALVERQDLDPTHMCELMHGILSGSYSEPEVAALLVALRMKGETAEELAAAAAVMREYMAPLRAVRSDILDTCGTGGDGQGTFNISTATALVAAAAGVPVVKHGNRAVSSQSGSADVLRELGVAVDLNAAQAQRCLQEVGITFCLAPQFHPAMRHVGQVRRVLGIRTMFNCLGPLANPAGASFQLLGAGRPEWLDRMASALARLRTRHALLVHGADGLDEVTLSGVTWVRQVRDDCITSLEWTPSTFRLEPCRVSDLSVEGPRESAALIRDILAGQQGAPLRIVLANSAAALLAAERVATIREGVEAARDAVESGKARRLLAEWADWSRSVAT